MAASALCALGLAASLACLAAIGPPPAVRIDALWVNDHRLEVRICLIGAAIAVAGTAAAMFGRRRWLVAGLWAVALAAAGAFFSDAIAIIARVLIDHAV